MGELTTGALDTLLPKLALLLGDEYSLPKSVKRDIDFLKSELESVYAVLSKLGGVPPGQEIKIWSWDARELSYDMEDVVDAYLVRVNGPKPPSERSSERFIKTMIKMLAGDRTRHQIGKGISDIKQRLKGIAERRYRYKIDDASIASQTSTYVIDPRIKAMYTRARDLVGMDDPMDELIELLTHGDEMTSTPQQQRVVCIFGFGGLGKTTLAKAVYDKLKGHFSCTAFVPVSRDPDLKIFLEDMLFDLDTQFRGIHGRALAVNELMDLAREFLHDKRYFIVLDDIWEFSVWESIRLVLYESMLGSKIIITTRIRDIAERVGYSYEMKPLTDESSRRLFCARIFGSKDLCPERLFELSVKILKKCGGVPLAIITIASLLASKSIDVDSWLYVCNSIGSGVQRSIDVDMEHMRKIISLSYYDLPSHLKSCLLYLSVYPEDHLIKKNKLIWNWIAQGFVREQNSAGLFETGERYFNELTSRSMIEPVEIEGTGVVQGCRVHVMVLDLIYSLSSEWNFVLVLDEAQTVTPSTRGRRLALQNNNREQSRGLYIYFHMENVRSLNATGCPMYMMPPLPSFRVLRVLDLESCGSMEGYNLKHLGTLFFLRFLGLRNTFINELPEEIGHLKCLQTLDLEGSGVEELPASMGQLTQLMCLNADWKTRVPDWIGKLTSLQQLLMYPGGGDDENSARWFIKELHNLSELRVLSFVIEVQDEEQVGDLLESLSNLRMIQVIHFNYYGVQLNSSVVSKQPEGFVLSQRLRTLEFRWLEFSRLPVWINSHDLPNLCHLWLMLSDVDQQDLGILGRFPDLRCLHLVIVNTEQGKVITSGGDGAFKSLKFCSITQPLKFLHGAMPRLEVLDFHFNVRLLRDADHDFDLDFGLGNLPSLQKVTVQINSLVALPLEVEKVEAALRQTVGMHPRRPTLEFT